MTAAYAFAAKSQAATTLDRDVIVAATAQAAQAEGSPMIKAVSARLDISYNAAKEAIKRARRRGFNIPYAHPNAISRAVLPAATPISGSALVCTCGHTVPLTDIYPAHTMRTHTLVTHARLPLQHELTPRRSAA